MLLPLVELPHFVIHKLGGTHLGRFLLYLQKITVKGIASLPGWKAAVVLADAVHAGRTPSHHRDTTHFLPLCDRNKHLALRPR
jgi:hypothetical protein